jgi:hypothetical protein
MDFSGERTLRQLAPVPWQFAVEIGIDVAAAVGAADPLGPRSSDIRPANISLSETGRPELVPVASARPAPADDADFFVAPEVVISGRRSPAGDVYALGATVLAAIVGRSPDLHDADWRDELGRLGVPEAVSAVMSKALSLSPPARYPTPADFASALVAAGGEPVTRPLPVTRSNDQPPAARLRPIDFLMPGPTETSIELTRLPPPVVAPIADVRQLSSSPSIDPPTAVLPRVRSGYPPGPSSDSGPPTAYLPVVGSSSDDDEPATEFMSARELATGLAFGYPPPPLLPTAVVGAVGPATPGAGSSEPDTEGFGALPTFAAMGYGGDREENPATPGDGRDGADGDGRRGGQHAASDDPDGRPLAFVIPPTRSAQAKTSVRLGVLLAAVAAVMLLAIGGWALATGGHHHPQSNNPGSPAPASSNELQSAAFADGDSPSVAGPTATMPTITGPNPTASTSTSTTPSASKSSSATSASLAVAATPSVANPSPTHKSSTPAKTKPAPPKTSSQNPVVPPPIVTSPDPSSSSNTPDTSAPSSTPSSDSGAPITP